MALRRPSNPSRRPRRNCPYDCDSRDKNLHKALLLSALLPGAGSQYVGETANAATSAGLFLFSLLANAGTGWFVPAIAWCYGMAVTYNDVISYNRSNNRSQR